MKRRQPPPPADDIPEWVRRCNYDDWLDLTEQPPPWCEDPHAWPSWWELRARRRWQGACKAWAANHPGVDLFALQHPETAANLRG